MSAKQADIDAELVRIKRERMKREGLLDDATAADPREQIPNAESVDDFNSDTRAHKANGGGNILLDPQDPMRSARELVASHFTTSRLRTLHRHRGVFWSWTGNCYRLAGDETIRASIWAFLEMALRPAPEGPPKPFKPNRARVGDVLDALGAVCNLDDALSPPAWLTRQQTPPAAELLAGGNGLLHLPTGKLYSHSPDYFNLVATDVAFDASAPKPVQWLSFLNQLFSDDQEAVELLQDWFGYALSPDTSQQKILLMVGPKRSGKGTTARVMSATVGRDAVAGPTMSSLGESFGLEPLITKTLAIVSDARIGARTDRSVITERLLSISGEDSMTIGRKFLSAWNGRLATRFVILTNELPSLSDGSGALAGRFLVLILTESFFGKEDPALFNKLATELPGILNWSIAGYRRLRDRGHFVQPVSSLDAVDDIEMLGAPVKAFIRDCCDLKPGLTVSADDLWATWQQWCVVEGQKSGNKVWFGRNLRTAAPGIARTRPRADEGDHQRENAYSGIALKPGAKQAKTAEANAARAAAKRLCARRARAKPITHYPLPLVRVCHSIYRFTARERGWEINTYA
jgi:putative DNA primase/helicase